MSGGNVRSRGELLRRLKVLCSFARALLVLLFALGLAPFVAVVSFLLAPMEDSYVSAPDGWGTVVAGFVRVALYAVALYLGQRALGRIAATGDPFRLENARDLNAIAVLVLASSVVPGCVGVLAAQVLQTGYVGSIVEVAPLAGGLVLLAATKIFEYGCILQRLDDETL